MTQSVKILRFNIQQINPIFIFSLSILLALPLIVDWVTQSWKLRESNNSIRFLTGLLMGISTRIFYFNNIDVELKKALFILIALIVLFLGLKDYN
jgi:uncharacterized membrane protein